MKMNIVIADDHALFRKGLSAVLATFDDIQIMGEADNGLELLQFLEHTIPDVVLLDIEMPVMNGFEVLENLAQKQMPVVCIMISMHDSEASIIRAIEGGACGFLSKHADPDEIVAAIKSAMSQGFYFNDKTNMAMLHKIAGRITKPEKAKTNGASFSDKEITILNLLCAGETSETIGKKLFLSPRTVEGIRQKMVQKVGAQNVIGLCTYAIKHGLIN